ncbi:hypothetical protein LIER_01745 [Lithospermum erythrorhizon]|uniref:PB1 domain-containing protein n=1 Tax=Lithospermum erythrorhizon TaxID=34254 RepID=A0AAV3NM36_LITER
MGKSGGRKKKSGVNQNNQAGNSDNNNNISINSSNKGVNVVNGVDLDSPILLQKAHELKEEGNKRFQVKDYVGALEQYENALKLIPKVHPDRAVFHSNKAACLMQMKPIEFEKVISECSLALQVQPRFVRALVRRARAFEAVGKYDMALQDVQVLLSVEPNQQDGLDIAGRLRAVLGPRQEAQQDLQSRPSPAALGASAALGAPITGLGPCLPPRPVSKKHAAPTVPSSNNKADKPNPVPSEKVPEPKPQLTNIVLKPLCGLESKDNHKEPTVFMKNIASAKQTVEVPIQLRPLKLAYDNDIRLSQMPVKCSFRALRDIVSKRFPMSKFVLIKYKDEDGDFVTITCTPELRLAESSVDSLVKRGPDEELKDSLMMLKLYIVEVSPEQEPPVPDEEEEEKLQEREDESPELEDTEGNESVLHSTQISSVLETAGAEVKKLENISGEKLGVSEDPECKEVEMDDWLYEFAQLFRTNVGIDPDAHIDLHELGMELCSEALEETITSEEAQVLFDKASLKFQEVAALALFNWGNVHMCAARKRIPIDDSASKESMSVQLQAAYDWVKEKYSLAKKKYEEALQIKADFYEGLLALGQQQFEMAKLHWSFVLAKKDDLSTWDPTDTLQLFDSAEELMKRATVMWEKLEAQRANELKDPNASKKDELLRRRKKAGGSENELSSAGGQGETSAEEVAEQAAVVRSQMHLFWGNMLFERSQVECKLRMAGWKENLDTAMERFKLAGASETDISTVLKNHCSNEEAAKGAEKKVENGDIGVADANDKQ